MKFSNIKKQNMTPAAMLDQLGTSEFGCFKGEVKSQPREV